MKCLGTDGIPGWVARQDPPCYVVLLGYHIAVCVSVTRDGLNVGPSCLRATLHGSNNQSRKGLAVCLQMWETGGTSVGCQLRRLSGGGGRMKLDWTEWQSGHGQVGWALEPGPGDSVTLIPSKATRTKAGAGSRAGSMGWVTLLLTTATTLGES